MVSTSCLKEGSSAKYSIALLTPRRMSRGEAPFAAINCEANAATSASDTVEMYQRERGEP